MKNYLDFKLSGSRVFPYFLCIFLAYIAYMIIYVYAATDTNPLSFAHLASIGFFLVYLAVVILCLFYIYRLFLTSISYNSEALKFDGEYSEYLKLNAIGILLSIVTLGIYSCWYQKRLCDYFARSTSFNNIKFKFNGQGIILFAIITVFIVLIVMVAVLFAATHGNTKNLMPLLVLMTVGILMCAPFYYLIYRWYIDLSHGTKKIAMKNGGCVSGSCYLLLQFFLILITFGFYYPAALIRIYRYFANRVEVRGEEGVLESKVGCDATMGQDFIFIFAQLLLTMVTLGIYYPWAMCTISERLITKTYIETIEN